MTTSPKPAKGPPLRVTLEGRYVRLEPLALVHAADLYRASEPERFRYLVDQPPASEADIVSYLAVQVQRDDAISFAVIDKVTGMAEGRQALMRFLPEHGTTELGYVYWGPRLARTRGATEALFLHLSYAFDELGYRRIEWRCNDRNEASKVAARRFGFQFEGLFRQSMIVKGENRDTAWFAMLDGDWPRLKVSYERWLDPSNFDATGQQLSKLQFG